MALAEDIGSGDATTLAIVNESLSIRALMIAREELVICGLNVAREVFSRVDESIQLSAACNDGAFLKSGGAILTIEGPARSILTAERTALNFIQRLSGISTLTARYVKEIEHTDAQLLDTRKTTPGWRALEKLAVSTGGARNHRFGLFDQILIKDNHLVCSSLDSENSVGAAIALARLNYPQLKVEVEADHVDQARQAVDAGADIVLLDNMSLDQLRDCVGFCRGKTKTEASGGVTIESIRSIAETGVDFISVGAITHSATAMDIGLDFQTL